MMKTILFVLLFLSLSSFAMALTATVGFTPPTNSTWVTDVLVTETAGDYSEARGQRSLPGAETVQIGNIKPETKYFFRAYYLDPATWMRSGWSNEVAITTEKYAEPVITQLPAIPIDGATITISVKVE